MGHLVHETWTQALSPTYRSQVNVASPAIHLRRSQENKNMKRWNLGTHPSLADDTLRAEPHTKFKSVPLGVQHKHKLQRMHRSYEKHARANKTQTAETFPPNKSKAKAAATQSSRPASTAVVGTDQADVAATAVPVPIPEDGQVEPSISIPKLYPATGGTLTVTPTFSVYSAVQSPISSGLQNTAVQSTVLQTPNIQTKTFWISPSSTDATPTAASLSSTPALSATNTAKHLPVVIIVLISVGTISLVAGILIVAKFLSSTNGRRTPPTPSAPILQDSPLFGGKERFSQRIWGGPSYATLATSQSNKTGIAIGPNKGGWKPLNGAPISDRSLNEKKRVPPPPLSPPLSAISFNPASPASNIGAPPDFTPPLPPSAAVKSVQPLHIKEKAKAGRRQSVVYRTHPDLAVSSPTFNAFTAYQAPRPAPAPGLSKSSLKVPASGSQVNRERVQAPYNNYASHLASPAPAKQSLKKHESFIYAVPTKKTDERRDRDTKALASALGLASPPLPSPSPNPAATFSPASLYPDDSLSVAHGHAYSEMPSPVGTHAALGNLMLQEFPSAATVASAKAVDGASWADMKNASASAQQRANGKKEDKAPRVPSPPPLPSLAQMAWENSDPDYRSPTYSIYGLYEAQRKSGPGGGY